MNFNTSNNQTYPKPLIKNSTGNDPTISKAMRYSQYVRMPGNSRTQVVSNNPTYYKTVYFFNPNFKHVNTITNPDNSTQTVFLI